MDAIVWFAATSASSTPCDVPCNSFLILTFSLRETGGTWSGDLNEMMTVPFATSGSCSNVVLYWDGRSGPATGDSAGACAGAGWAGAGAGAGWAGAGAGAAAGVFDEAEDACVSLLAGPGAGAGAEAVDGAEGPPAT